MINLFAGALAYSAFGAQAVPISGAYDFYIPSVKRGSTSFAITDNELDSKAVPGFAASTDLTLTFVGSKLKKAVYKAAKGAEVTYSFGADGNLMGPAKGMLYSPMHPILLDFLLREYDLKRGGFQALKAVDLAKGTPRVVKAELYRTLTRTFNGKTLDLREWRFETPPTAEAVIWTDTNNIPLYWWVPKVNYEVVMRGCEDLRPATKFAGAVSPPRFASKVEKDVWIPMRDGVRLQCDVYRPDGPGEFPVILQRSPYDRSEFGNADGEFYSQRGYVYVTEHVRGRGGSEGNFAPTLNEAPDGYDTIKWCGTQPWSNGKVAMVGASYNGFCCWMAAKTQPKWLKTMISVVPMPGPPDGAFWDHGAAYISTSLGWFGLLRDRTKVQAFNDDITKAMNTLPLSQIAQIQFGKVPQGFNTGMTSNTFDKEMQRGSYRYELDKINMPVLYFDGWMDPIAIATKKNYLSMVQMGRKNQKLIFGPWDHFTNQESIAGATDFGPDGYIDMRTTCLRWFDRWLKGMPNGIEREPAVSDFVIGEGWRHENQWPPAETKSQRWFLQANGTLAPKLPTKSHPSQYTYNPAKYVYSSAYPNGYFGQVDDDAAYLCRQKGQLLFDSRTLKSPLTLDGPISGTLYAASSAKDTDWVMTLIDRHPDGVCVPLAAGFARARYRNSLTHPAMLKPGEIVAYHLDLFETGIKIPAGHKLRIAVCSTMFPDTDRNLNTGEPIFNATRIVVAKQKIYHDRAHPSFVGLPVLG